MHLLGTQGVPVSNQVRKVEVKVRLETGGFATLLYPVRSTGKKGAKGNRKGEE